MLTPRLLIVDDDLLLSTALRDLLAGPTLAVSTASSAADALRLARKSPFDVILLDQKLPDGSGADLCPAFLDANEKTKIVFQTAYPNFDNALAAIRGGAFDYLSKPCDPEQVRLAVDRCLRTLRLEKAARVQEYRAGLASRGNRLIGEEGGLSEVAGLVRLAASGDMPVLLTGETGTGKSLVARALHDTGPRRGAELIAVNCGALPESLIESELFGHEKGAFTGAAAGREGLFEMAEGGTLFLDEIGEMPPLLQTRLLGVLEEKVIRRVGGRTFRPVDFRLVAATNVDVEAALGERRLREDLYYRLDVFRIHVPPLRERLEDLPALVAHFLSREAAWAGGEALAEGELERLADYPWPGNLRELKNVLERSRIVHRGGKLRPSTLLRAHRSPRASTPHAAGPEAVTPLDELERRAVRHAVAATSGNLTHAARALGISVSTLRRKLGPGGLAASN
jgi:DNA-binding NtrC family response regulator